MVKRNQADVMAAREERKSARGKQVAPKFQEAREELVKTNPLVPLNDKQRDYMHKIESLEEE